MRQHPDSDRLTAALARCRRHEIAWAGTVYRSAAVRYANRDDFLTGAGAKAGGARWNPPDSFAAVYASLAPDTATLEALAHHRYFGLPAEAALPRVLAAARVALQRVLDLTDARVRKPLGLTREALLAEDWRAANRDGREAVTQAVGRVAWAAEVEALLVPSAAALGGTNLIVFPGNLTPPGSYLLVVNRDLLPPLPGV